MPTRTRLAALALPLALAAAVAARPDDPKPAAAPVGVSPIGAGFVTLDFAAVWDHKALAPVREGAGSVELTWAMRSLIGFSPAEVARLTVYWKAADRPALVVTTREPHDAAAVMKGLARPGGGGASEAPPAGFLHAPGAEFPYARKLDDRTLALFPASYPRAELADAVREPMASGPLVSAGKAAAGHTLFVVLGPTGARLLPIDGPLAGFDTATLTADLGKEPVAVKLAVTYPTGEKAAAAAPQVRAKLDDLAGLAAGRARRAEKGSAGGTYPAPLLDWLAETLKGAKVTADGAALGATAEFKLDEAVGRLLMALPDSAFAARGSSGNENNLKQIALAFHNYESAHGNFPTNIYDKDGKPLLSWRVAILPYIEQDAVYKQFKLDEPWDSDHNKTFSMVAIKTFMVPGRPAGTLQETYYRAFIGPKEVKPEHRPLFVEGQMKGLTFPAITDGTSNTLMVVEAGEAVPWAKPDDLVYDGVKPLPKLGGPNGSFGVAFCDGSVRTFRRASLDEATLRGAITAAGGEVFSLPGR